MGEKEDDGRFGESVLLLIFFFLRSKHFLLRYFSEVKNKIKKICYCCCGREDHQRHEELRRDPGLEGHVGCGHESWWGLFLRLRLSSLAASSFPGAVLEECTNCMVLVKRNQRLMGRRSKLWY